MAKTAFSVATLAIGTVLVVATTESISAQGTKSPKIAERTGYRISSWRSNAIDHQNQLLLVRAAMTGAPDGMVLFATEIGATDRAVRAVTSLGGGILARFDDVGYFRARLPLKQFAKADRSPGVLMALIDGAALAYASAQGMVQYTPPRKPKADSIRADSVARDSTARDSAFVAAMPSIPDAGRAAETPYVAMNDMRSYDMRRIDPRFDGRGITVAVLEYGTLDFLHPTLQKATALDGSTIQKLRGVITPYSYDPDFVQPDMLVGGSEYGGFDQARVRRSQEVTPVDGKFVVDDSTYSAPNGKYSFGLYKKGKKPRAVIWDDQRKLAWVDANGDKSFTDEKAMSDINTAFSIGTLVPLDSTAKEPKRSAYFAIQFDSIPGMLRIYEGTQGHQTMVASVATGHDILGAANASASGAQLVIVDAGLMLYSYLEAWLRAARDPRVDVITSSQVGEAGISGGESILALVLNRAVEVYGKPFFASAHNSGPGTTSGGEAATIPRVMSIGGYANAATYKAHYNWDTPDRDYLVSYSSRGPSTNGGAKPDVVAPVLSVSAAPCLKLKPDRTIAYRFPDCHSLAGGTSSSSPHAAGAAALLMSAAKQSNLPYDARHITWALRMGARFLPNIPAHEQGAGLIDVVRSLELLKMGIDPPDIETRAPVRTRVAKLLRDPGFGDGLFEREGWKAGDRGTRVIRLTRRTGPKTPVTYGLDWRGNDGTFESVASAVTLPLDVAVPVTVRLAPRTSGIHSAHLLVTDRKTGVPVHHVLHTVIAAEPLTAANKYAASYRERMPWPRAKSFFVNVPEGTASLRLDLAVNAGRVRLSASDATLDRSYYNRFSSRPYRYPTKGANELVYPGKHGTYVIADPEPGVMEILVESYGSPSPATDSVQYNVPSEFELKAQVQQARGVAGASASTLATNGGGGAPVTFTNLQAPIGEGRIRSEVGARRVLASSAGGSPVPTSFYINVDSGTATLRVAVAAGNPKSDLALYLYDCAGPKCALWDLVQRDGPKQSFLVVKPRAGAWKVVVDAPASGATEVGFTYTEIMTHPRFGSADSAVVATSEADGARWTARLPFSPNGTPKAGYEWVGVADLYDEAVERAERDHPLARFLDHIPAYRPVRLATVVIPLPGGHRLEAATGR